MHDGIDDGRMDDQVRRDCIALCGAVRVWDRTTVSTIIGRADLEAVCIMLAAMIPPGKRGADLLAWAEDQPDAITPAGVDIPALAGRALVLAAAVRTWDYAGVAATLRKNPLHAMAVVLAAMVPEDEPVDELLAWVGGGATIRSSGPTSERLRRLADAVA